MTRRDKIEAVAKFLNRVCSDWPPLAYDWDSKQREAGMRRRDMRDLAREVLEQINQ